MRSLLEKQCVDVLHASTVKSFSNQIVAFVNDCELEIFAATVITDHSPTLSEFQSCSNVPSKYLDSFLDLPSGKRDPVSQFCKTSSAPIFWNRQTYIDAQCDDLWDYQSPYGIKEGISLAIHLPRGRHFFSERWATTLKKENRTSSEISFLIYSNSRLTPKLQHLNFARPVEWTSALIGSLPRVSLKHLSGQWRAVRSWRSQGKWQFLRAWFYYG